jgi:hypothetical protein
LRHAGSSDGGELLSQLLARDRFLSGERLLRRVVVRLRQRGQLHLPPGADEL